MKVLFLLLGWSFTLFAGDICDYYGQKFKLKKPIMVGYDILACNFYDKISRVQSCECSEYDCSVRVSISSIGSQMGCGARMEAREERVVTRSLKRLSKKMKRRCERLGGEVELGEDYSFKCHLSHE